MNNISDMEYCTVTLDDKVCKENFLDKLLNNVRSQVSNTIKKVRSKIER